jgi:hypothetical protein
MFMATYHFDLVTLDGRVLDLEGTELADEASARDHARQVACELMRHRESPTRSWKLEVSDFARRFCFELLFVSVDSTIDHLTPDLRANVEKPWSQSAALAETMHAVRKSVAATRATLARADGRPHLSVVSPLADREKQCDGEAF